MFNNQKFSLLFAGLLVSVFFLSQPAFSAETKTTSDVKPLPPAQTQCDVDLITLLKKRHSDKAYTEKELELGQLSTVLWAANGVNRENGKRTAPAPYSMPFVQIFVATSDGTWLFEPPTHQLRLVSQKNIKSILPLQPAYASASVILLLVADLSQFPKPEIATESKILLGHCTAGHIAQNVYLAAGALGLGTCMVANVASDSARRELSLREDQIPLYLMPLGFTP